MGAIPSEMQKVLKEAIYREEEAHRFYLDLAAKIKNPDGAKTFSNLAEDEKGHRGKLEGWYKELSGDAFVFDEGEVEPIAFSVDEQAAAMDALDVALMAEEKAAKGYESLAKNAPDDRFSSLCKSLADEEWGHYETISAEKQVLADEFYWFDIDFARHVED
jgi:rubrerythrin